MSELFQRAQGYVGTPYIPDVFDCADLAVRVQWELFCRVIALPENRRRSVRASVQSHEIQRLQAELAIRIDEPVTGCAVMMFTPGVNVPVSSWHVGTVFVEEGVVWVLHNCFTMGSTTLLRLTDLRRLGLRLDGFYAWKDHAPCTL